MIFRVAIAVGVAYLLFRMGFAVLRSIATPLPEPPPSGELRRVNLRYRCSMCGTEIRVTRATDEEPVPPRHCLDEMEPVTPAE